jgi:hypothetical protein
MGTNVYGSYDQLVIELGGLDRWKAGRREVRIALDDVWSVRAADPRDLVTFAGERVLRVGRRHGGAPVLVLDLSPSAELDRIVVATPEADDLAEGLRRSGVGLHDRPLAAAR